MRIIYSVSDKYLSDFALHGTTEKDFSEKLYDDLKAVIKVRPHLLLTHYIIIVLLTHYIITVLLTHYIITVS